jgi:hypothetical protein
MIDPNKWYSLAEIQSNGFLPFIKSYYLMRKWVESKKLKAATYGTNHTMRYFVKGSDLITFIAKWEAGDFQGRIK